MEEVIAFRYNMSKKSCLCFIVMGVLCLILGVFFVIAKEFNLYYYPEERQWVLVIIYVLEFIMGVLAIISGIINLFRAKKIPSELIVLNGNSLTFADGLSCDVKEVKDVKYHVNKLDNSGVGALQVVLSDRKINYKSVRNVVSAHKRLMELMADNGNKEN